MKNINPDISFFERYLTIWVLLCMMLGLIIAQWAPIIPSFLTQFDYYGVSIPVALLVWLMIFPMMLKIDWAAIKAIKSQKKGMFITLIINWFIKPVTMYGFAYLFFIVLYKNIITPPLAYQYLAGAVLLGAAPCTAMVFVWSALTKGSPAYTLVQVIINDLLVLILYAPIVMFLLKISNITIPLSTLLSSVLIFIIIPLILAIITRITITYHYAVDYLNTKVIPYFSSITIVALLLTLTILFSFQGKQIIAQPFHILLIAIPLTIQTYVIFFTTFNWAKKSGLPHNIATPSGMIGASNFFELAVAVSITIFGLHSGATLATIVGVLVEVPIMLSLVRYANRNYY